MEDVGLVDISERWPEAVGPSQEFRFGVPCDEIARDCAVDWRGWRRSGPPVGDGRGSDGDGDEGWLSFFLKNLPNSFFGPPVGVELMSARVIVGADGDDEVSTPAEESE